MDTVARLNLMCDIKVLCDEFNFVCAVEQVKLIHSNDTLIKLEINCRMVKASLVISPEERFCVNWYDGSRYMHASTFGSGVNNLSGKASTFTTGRESLLQALRAIFTDIDSGMAFD